mgnify:CR=1 FL=1
MSPLAPVMDRVGIKAPPVPGIISSSGLGDLGGMFAQNMTANILGGSGKPQGEVPKFVVQWTGNTDPSGQMQGAGVAIYNDGSRFEGT